MTGSCFRCRSPRRLFEQSIPTLVRSAALAFDPLVLRQLVETMVQEMPTREFAGLLGLRFTSGPTSAVGCAMARGLARW